MNKCTVYDPHDGGMSDRILILSYVQVCYATWPSQWFNPHKKSSRRFLCMKMKSNLKESSVHKKSVCEIKYCTDFNKIYNFYLQQIFYEIEGSL